MTKSSFAGVRRWHGVDLDVAASPDGTAPAVRVEAATPPR